LLIDCTGDARAAIDAGVGHTTGRPEDGATQPMTLMFEMQDTGRAVRPYMPEGAHSYGSVGELPQGRVLIFDRNDEGRVLVNMTRVRGNGSVNADVAHAELESMRQAFGVAAFLQSNGMPNHCVSSMAPQIGVRQTNQIEGDYTLTVADIVAGASFDDVAAQTDYEVDIHDPTGGTGNEEYGVRMYDIPYRCMLPRGLEGMLVAGRCVSADHTAMSSLRTIPTCMALGQAAGVAACVALESGRGLRDIDMGLFHGGLRAQGVEFVSH
ncbi:MAG: FAD-dependent oxidoreductase, partial [Oscillospiraceae bacterium]|nr:FAD-dependent oxidoreductase [Oscillospiraceae bacterium]